MAVVCRFRRPIEGVLINGGLLGVQWNVILILQMVSSGPSNVLPRLIGNSRRSVPSHTRIEYRFNEQRCQC